jgi:undecaprenyl-diphosphatase
VIGAVGKRLTDLRDSNIATDDVILMVVGIVFAAVAGYLSIRWLLIFLSRAPLYAFVGYRIVVGLVVIALASRGLS